MCCCLQTQVLLCVSISELQQAPLLAGRVHGWLASRAAGGYAECVAAYACAACKHCNVWDAHMGSAIPMTATAVPFHYNSFRFIPYNLVCVEPLVTHQSSWLETTGVCGVQNQPGWSSLRNRAYVPLLVVWAK